MDRLSRPIGEMRPHYDAVVVGSGYGGAIAACRLARAGRSVCVLERGRELLPGEYPERLLHGARESQTHVAGRHFGSRTALFDIRAGRDVSVVVGCGLGGTSLINANVALEADPRVFDDDRWPEALRGGDELLADGYDKARTMLGSTPYPDDAPRLAKFEALERSGHELGHRATKPPINVTFTAGPNAAGVHQKACTGCGNCVTGCNGEAKNTVLMNYLPDAHAHGAHVFTECEVWTVEPMAGGGWRVAYHVRGQGREVFGAPTQFVTADVVVLGAGTLGSTGILLRSARAGLTVSEQLGERFSANGDVIGFAYDSDSTVNGLGVPDHGPLSADSPGPCITGVIDLRGAPDVDDGLVIEDAVLPSVLTHPLELVLLAASATAGKGPARIRSALRGLREIGQGARSEPLQRTLTYLVMSHDDGCGRLVLDNDAVTVHWPDIGQQPFRHDNARLEDAARAVGATSVRNPFWSKPFGDALVTVHPLGGCVMADDARDGVVDDRGRVFSGPEGNETHGGLYVADGSIVPRPLGVNPLLTISALAERISALLIEEPRWDDSAPAIESAVRAPVTTPGLRFTERMTGFFSTKVRRPNRFGAGFRQGRADASSLEFVVTVDVDDVDALVRDASQVVRLSGTVVAPALAPGRCTVVDGAFALFVPQPDFVETSFMRYHLPLRTEDGRHFVVDGHKTLRNGATLGAWGATTTLDIAVTDEHDVLVGVGRLHIRPSDFLRQLTTMRVPRAGSPAVSMRALGRFAGRFAREVVLKYGGLAAEAHAFDEVNRPRRGRALRLKPPDVVYCHSTTNTWDERADDDGFLRLTRFRGGERGPVILAPGFGMSTAAFVTETIDTNLTEYLVHEGFDVWLLDFRWSPDLPTARRAFTIDDVARVDWPMAVDEVRSRTGADEVDVIAHCVGSMSFLMAMLAGMQGVRAAVCSQVTTHPKMTFFHRLKTRVRTGKVLQGLGVRTIQPDLTPNLPDRLLDLVLRIVPTKREEHCNSAVCRWIFAFYGPTHRHAQLNQATHEDLGRLFGVADIDALNHISRIVRKGRAVDADGHDAYIPHAEQLRLPILFLAGAHNRIFLPETSARTLEWLSAANGPHWYRRIVLDDYAHLDGFIGRDAAAQVYPVMADFLKAHAGSPPPSTPTAG